MATPHEILTTVRDTLDNSASVPDSVNYLVAEYDASGEDANVSLPVVQLTAVGVVNLNEFNTDLVGYVTDSNGNQVGRRYHSEYQMEVQVDVMTVDGRTEANESIEPLTKAVRNELYKYDSAGPDNTLDPDVWRFHVDDAERADNLSTTPAIRRWRQDLSCWSHEVFETTEDYIATVNFPDSVVYESGNAG